MRCGAYCAATRFRGAGTIPFRRSSALAQGAMHPAWIRTGPIEYKAKKKKKNAKNTNKKYSSFVCRARVVLLRGGKERT